MRAHKLDLSCVRVDFDADGDVDVADFAEMQPSLIGGAYPAASPAYRYDCRNQMDSFTDGATGVRTAYLYDALGRRIGKIVDADGPSPQVTYFFYDGVRIVEERDGSGSTTATYVYGRYIDEVLTARRDADGNGTPEDYFFHADDLYNVLTVTDAAGQVVERYEYGAFGKPTIYAPDAVTVRPASAIGNNRLWNGREYDAETGLYYYRTRYLDPRIGRFTTRDTIGIWGDPMNLGNGYAYVGNNPWTHGDPYGEDWRTQWKKDKDAYREYRRQISGDPRFWPKSSASPPTSTGGHSYPSDAWVTNAKFPLYKRQPTLSPDHRALEPLLNFGDVVPPFALVHGVGHGIEGDYDGAAWRVGLGALGTYAAVAKLGAADCAGRVVPAKVVDKAWKGLIEGRAHGTPAHMFRTYREAITMAKGGQYERVHINQWLKTSSGGWVDSQLRPDVVGVRPGGMLDMIEVPHPGQTPAQMWGKIWRMEDLLGDRAGPGSNVVPIR